MRVLFANDSISDAGGVGTYLDNVIPALQRRGHDVALLYVGGEPERGPASLRAIDHVRASASVAATVKAAMAWSPDVIYSHNMNALAIEAALSKERAVVKFMHGYFGTCISGLKTHAAPRREPCGRAFGAACIALYYPRRCGQLDPRKAWSQYRWSIDQRALFNRYARIIVASKHMADEYVRSGVEAERVSAIPLFAPARDGESSEQKTIDILFAGRMTHLKGGDVLIRAVARASKDLPRLPRVIFAGGGAQRDEWQRLSADLGVRAEFLGWVSNDEVDRLLSRTRLLVVPSVWPEPFGLVGLQAARLGVPAVAFNVGGISEWLIDGESGLLAGEVPSVDGMAEVIARVLRDDELHAALATGAKRVASRMSLDEHVNRLETVLKAAAAH